jgi:AcrR family transcriptional regulator
MSESHQFITESTGTVDTIMQATYRSIQQHGYTNLTIAMIAEEAGLSKSALYNHYDGKDDLLLEFLGRFLECYLTTDHTQDDHDPYEELQLFIAILSIDHADENSVADCLFDDPSISAFVESRAQAIHNEGFREQFCKEDNVLKSRLTRIIQRGIDDGVFRDAEPVSVAEFILTVLEGTLFRHSLKNDDTSRSVYSELDKYIHHHLLLDG